MQLDEDLTRDDIHEIFEDLDSDDEGVINFDKFCEKVNEEGNQEKPSYQTQ
jgi:Ca2+-binding EF-hand superfamily protein